MARLFGEVWKEWGVDEESKHNQVDATYMMVPLDGVNLVLLKDRALTWEPDRAHLEVREVTAEKSLPASWLSKVLSPTKTGMATGVLTGALAIAKQQSARLLAVRGIKHGPGTIDAKAGKTTKETLAVGVHPRQTVKLSFHFVGLKGGGAAGKAKPLSGWTTSHVTRWVADLNRIFTPQANVAIKQHRVEEPPVARYSGASVPYKSAEEWTDEVGRERDKTADANVFLLGKWTGISDDRYKDVNGTYIIATRDIAMDDRSSYDLFMTTLAHEMGHFLGYRKGNKFGHPDADKRHWLMTTIDWTKGVKVPRDYVQLFNPL